MRPSEQNFSNLKELESPAPTNEHLLNSAYFGPGFTADGFTSAAGPVLYDMATNKEFFEGPFSDLAIYAFPGFAERGLDMALGHYVGHDRSTGDLFKPTLIESFGAGTGTALMVRGNAALGLAVIGTSWLAGRLENYLELKHKEHVPFNSSPKPAGR